MGIALATRREGGIGPNKQVNSRAYQEDTPLLTDAPSIAPDTACVVDRGTVAARQGSSMR